MKRNLNSFQSLSFRIMEISWIISRMACRHFGLSVCLESFNSPNFFDRFATNSFNWNSLRETLPSWRFRSSISVFKVPISEICLDISSDFLVAVPALQVPGLRTGGWGGDNSSGEPGDLSEPGDFAAHCEPAECSAVGTHPGFFGTDEGARRRT